MTDELAGAISDLEEATAVNLVRKRLDAGADPLAIPAACQEGMGLVGKRCERASISCNPQPFLPIGNSGLRDRTLTPAFNVRTLGSSLCGASF